MRTFIKFKISIELLNQRTRNEIIANVNEESIMRNQQAANSRQLAYSEETILGWFCLESIICD